jgi:hypothetical protein
MSEQPPNPESSPPQPPSTEPPPTGANPPPAYSDRREQRRAERMARREVRLQRTRRPYGWLWGAILIFLGFIFLLQNLGYNVLVNWWAVLILFPAFWAYAAAWNIYTERQRLTASAIGSLLTGVLLTLLAAIFLFNLNTGIFWPVLLIVAGLALILTVLLPRSS